MKQLQRDILDLLQRYANYRVTPLHTYTLTLPRHDTEPSLLKHVIEPTSTEPSPKKAKLSDHSDTSLSIADRLRDARYTSLDQIQSDAVRFSEHLAASIRARAKDRDGYSADRPTVEDLKQINKARSLAILVKEIVNQEREYAAPKAEKEQKPETDGQTQPPASTQTGRVSSVLTLFGNAPTPKQLFTSMQHPTSVSDQFVKSELPVEEMSLPNGIAATRIISAPAPEDKRGPTFEQAFAPPYNLQPLSTPKAHKRTATRDNAVSWEFKDPIQRNRRGGYTVQPLSTSTWLSYGGADGEDVASPRQRQKLRERALSSADGSVPNPFPEVSEHAARREEESLFRRAYSSFAPTRDDCNAIVPEESKNDVWWHKVGEKRFNNTLAVDPALLDEQYSSAPAFEDSAEFNEDELSRIIEGLDELENAEMQQVPESAKSNIDVDQVLREVNALLEALASYQRIRNATLAPATSSSRPPISPGPVSSRTGKPDQPSEEEVSTYQSLQRELAYLLLKLPPYAVAKLDGDQLADLGVKSVVTFEQKDVKGVMEEDLVTRQAKLAQQATAASIANLARPNSSAGQHYSQTAQRTPAIGQAANTRYGQQYTGRPPTAISQFQRQASNPAAYGTPNSAVRPSYGQNQQYTRPGAPQTNYAQANGQQYYQQRPLQQTPGGYGNYNQHTSLQQRPTYGQGPSQPQYQQRAQASAANYHSNATTQQHAYSRNISPIKSAYPTPAPPVVAQLPRPMYPAQPQQQQPGSGRATPVSYPSQPNTPVNGYQPARPMQGLAPRPTSTTPQPTHNSGPAQPPPQQQAVQANGTS